MSSGCGSTEKADFELVISRLKTVKNMEDAIRQRLEVLSSKIGGRVHLPMKDNDTKLKEEALGIIPVLLDLIRQIEITQKGTNDTIDEISSDCGINSASQRLAHE